MMCLWKEISESLGRQYILFKAYSTLYIPTVLIMHTSKLKDRQTLLDTQGTLSSECVGSATSEKGEAMGQIQSSARMRRF